MTQWFSPVLNLWGLFASSLLGATLLPGGSEAVLIGVLQLHPAQIWAALAVATLGNTLGGLISFGMGRVLPPNQRLTQIGRVRRYGAPVLALAWLPLVGDALCLAAGWLRLSFWQVALYMAVGKFARYAVVALAAQPLLIH